MHNGHFRTLREAVAFYATRDTNPERWYPGRESSTTCPSRCAATSTLRSAPTTASPGQRPALNDEEIDDIVAFLRTLTDGYAP